MYAENLARVLQVPPSPQRDALLGAFVDGRLDENLLQHNLERLQPPPT